MAASTVTGRGLGDSHGLPKPENHCGGCGCGKVDETPITPPPKVPCHTKLVNNQKLKHVSVLNNSRVRTCI